MRIRACRSAAAIAVALLGAILLDAMATNAHAQDVVIDCGPVPTTLACPPGGEDPLTSVGCFRDCDGDGQGGLPRVQITGCFLCPEGWLFHNEDCDDSRPNVFFSNIFGLGEAVDVCDGQINDCLRRLGPPTNPLPPPPDGSTDPNRPSPDCVCLGAEGWSCPTCGPPSSEVCDGGDNDCDGNIDENLSCPCIDGDCPNGDCGFCGPSCNGCNQKCNSVSQCTATCGESTPDLCFVEANSTTNADQACLPGTNCQLDCNSIGQHCTQQCGAGSTCDLDCNSTNTCEAQCEAGSTCDISCNSTPNCNVTCLGDASCVISFCNSSNCQIACDGTVTDCGGGKLVCNGSCP